MKRRTSRAQTAVTTTDDHGGDGRRDPVAVYECLDILLKLAHTVIVSRIGARELNRLVTDEACRTRSRRCGHRFAADRSTRPCSLYQEGGFCGRDRSRLPKHDAVSTARGGNIDQTLVGRTAPCKVERVARLHEGAVHKHVGGIQQAGGAGRINMRQHRRDVGRRLRGMARIWRPGLGLRRTRRQLLIDVTRVRPYAQADRLAAGGRARHTQPPVRTVLRPR